MHGPHLCRLLRRRQRVHEHGEGGSQLGGEAGRRSLCGACGLQQQPTQILRYLRWHGLLLRRHGLLRWHGLLCSLLSVPWCLLRCLLCRLLCLRRYWLLRLLCSLFCPRWRLLL